MIYSYTKASLHQGQLEAQIIAALPYTVNSMLYDVDQLTIDMNGTLTPGEETTLEGIVTAHVPEAVPKEMICSLDGLDGMCRMKVKKADGTFGYLSYNNDNTVTIV